MPGALIREGLELFAAGDVVTGPTDITRAVGEGRRAAHMIDRWLTGGAMTGFDDRLPVVDGVGRRVGAIALVDITKPRDER